MSKSKRFSQEVKEWAVRLSGMTHVRTSPYYPHSNGKIEAWHKTLNVTTNGPKALNSLEQAQEEVASFVDYYNRVRLHSANGYVALVDKLEDREKTIWRARDQKLEKARENRRARRVVKRFLL